MSGFLRDWHSSILLLGGPYEEIWGYEGRFEEER